MLRPLLAASAVLLIALPARGEPSPDAATLTYLPSRATAAFCPAANFFVLEVQIRLGYALFQPSAPNHLTLKVERENGLFRSTGEMRDGSGRVIFTRVYSEIDCGTVLVSMAISVALELTKLPEEPEPRPPARSPPAPTPPAPLPPASPLPPLPPKSPAAPSLLARLHIGLGANAASNLAPSVVVGPAWLIGARLSNISVALEGRALFGPTVQVNGLPVMSSVVTGGASACLHSKVVFACGLFDLAALHFSQPPGLDLAPNDPLIVGFGPRVGADWIIAERFTLRGYADVLVLATPVHLQRASDNRVLWTLPQPSPSFGIGLVRSFD